MTDVKLIISVAEEYYDRILEVSEDLQQLGMRVSQVLPEVGVMMGAIDETQVGLIFQVPGVGAVETEGGFQLAPPDAEIQ